MSDKASNTNSYKFGSRLLFNDSAGIQPYLLDGWADHEPNHRWTVGHQAQLRLNIPNVEKLEKQDFLLRVQCSAFLAGGKLNHQSVDVVVNGNHVATWLVRQMAWHEATVANSLIANGSDILTFVISNPTAPVDSQLSSDPRKLGLDFRVLEIAHSGRPDLNDPTLGWIGNGEDPIGDVFRKDGNYYRAIKKTAAEHVRNLIDQGVYQHLASRKLIPEHIFWDIEHPKYAMVAQSRTGTFVFPSNYALSTLKNAAYVWLDINEFLLDVDGDYGLIDGHYGNFALFDNSRPLWVDIGSIGQGGGAFGDPCFGLNQFIQYYVYPLLMFHHQPDNTTQIRALMLNQPDGITYAQLTAALNEDFGLANLNPSPSKISRRATFRQIREILADLDFSSVKGFWSGYRNVESLELAIQGRLLDADQDSRFRAVVGLVRRSAASTFIDIGANDGAFSLLCTREGRKGIAIDLDDFSLNKLYQFISTRPDVELTVSYGSFSSVPHTAELVLALAITHHLVISQGLTFSQISKSLALNSTKAVITEFMPDGLGGTADIPGPYPDPLPKEYTLENFVSALRENFSHVEVIDYARPNPLSRRILIYCEGPKRS